MTELIKPKQKRSEITQQKILQSLNRALSEKYFEHISIAELAEGAGVSVGTFYRRFKDKNALIPLLYQDFGEHLSRWVTQLESHEDLPVEQVFAFLIRQTTEFVRAHEGVFRTLHLYARLYPGLVSESQMTERTQEFERIAQWLHERLFGSQIDATKITKCQVWVFMIVDTLVEKILYNTLTPAMACPVGVEQYSTHLNQCLYTEYRGML